MRKVQVTTIVVFLVLAGVIAYAAPAIYVAPNGNVGIGTSNPLSSLHLMVPNDNGFSLESSGNPFFSMTRNGTVRVKMTCTSHVANLYGNGTLNLGGALDTTHLTIAGNGYVGISTSAPQDILHIYQNSPTGIRWERSGYDTYRIGQIGTGFSINNVTDNRYDMVFLGNGNVQMAGTLNQNSDLRLKKDIKIIDNALDKVSQLRGVNYRWIDASRGNGLQMGVIAQEVEKVFPEVVSTDDKGMKSVSYTSLVGALVESVKELKKQNAEMKAKFEKEIQDLKSRIK